MTEHVCFKLGHGHGTDGKWRIIMECEGETLVGKDTFDTEEECSAARIRLRDQMFAEATGPILHLPIDERVGEWPDD